MSAAAGGPPTHVESESVTLRFLVAPSDMDASGSTVQAGRVLEWIDKAGYACAVGWSASYCVTAYVGDVHFTRPIPAGLLVEAHARIIHTGRTSMHVYVSIDTADVHARRFTPATHCILVLVAVDESGAPREVPRWEPWGDGDRTIQSRAESRIEPRRLIQSRMLEQEFTTAGTAPRTVFRFMAAPGDGNWGGNAHGGTVMRWIDETAYACAAGWASPSVVAVYSGGIHFYRPIRIGHIVEIDARLIHTSERSMHISIRVRSGSPTEPRKLELTTQCLTVFVEKGADGRAQQVPRMPLVTEEDRRLDAHARELIHMRASMAVLPAGLARQASWR
ncbi:acyl-CoA thioesterase [Leifsonia sp. Leaf264]|uniref:acyl-CoA thioesterase n=1 Tax=Leifsonia sp. Leaf264 TaxID=1736314 RepID=UPI0006F77499|nr:acyl-CoA thioesterase [Leifsonia sp. Leaf264]KQO97448.1 acyl-CoA thioesterase [Leifsonia sp. Leaf264]